MPLPMNALGFRYQRTRGPTLEAPPVSHRGDELLGRAANVRVGQLRFLSTDAHQLSLADLREANTLLEDDVLRALQRLPGVGSRDDCACRLLDFTIKQNRSQRLLAERPRFWRRERRGARERGRLGSVGGTRYRHTRFARACPPSDHWTQRIPCIGASSADHSWRTRADCTPIHSTWRACFHPTSSHAAAWVISPRSSLAFSARICLHLRP